MLGRNTMLLNQATIIEAVQEWLDKRFIGATQRVVSVEERSGGGIFEIDVEQVDDRTSGPAA